MQVVPDTGGKGIHRNIAERVVEEMADQIGKQHQPTGEADLPDADAADEFCKLLLRNSDHAIQSNSGQIILRCANQSSFEARPRGSHLRMTVPFYGAERT